VLQPREKPPPAGLLSCDHLSATADAFLEAGPTGFMKLTEVTDMMCHLAGQGSLPPGWLKASYTQMLAAVHELDPTFSGYADWRELIANLVLPSFPLIATASSDTLAQASLALAAADANKDGFLERAEWMSTSLWFERKPLEAMAAEEEGESEGATTTTTTKTQEEFDRAGKLKEVVWKMFCVPAPPTTDESGAAVPSSGEVLDLTAVLLYLCADRNVFNGIKKAFAVVTRMEGKNPKALAEHVMKIAYPLGPLAGESIHRAPLDAAAVAEAVAAISELRGSKLEGQAAVNPEELMYSAPGEKLVNHLMGRYQYKDLYISTLVRAA
jgi:hypothetical protein